MYIVATLRCNVAEGSLLAFFRCVITAPDCSVAKCNATSGGEFVKIIGEHLFLQSKYRSGRARLTCFYQKSDEITGQMAPRLCLICTFVCAIFFSSRFVRKKIGRAILLGVAISREITLCYASNQADSFIELRYLILERKGWNIFRQTAYSRKFTDAIKS